MGCDIHSYIEVRDSENEPWTFLCEGPFRYRSYSYFGLLAGVRNYSAVQPIALPRGIPEDASTLVSEECEDEDAHSRSWFTASELLGYDWDQIIEDRRCSRRISERGWDGSCTCQPGGGERMTLRQFVGEHFMCGLKLLESLRFLPENVRVVFFFDN